MKSFPTLRLAGMLLGIVLHGHGLLRAGDATQFTLVIYREPTFLQGRGVEKQIYVNERYVGGVSNGQWARFSIPINDAGVYKLRARTWDSFFTGGALKQFSAKPGEEVVATVGLDLALWDGHVIRSIRVFPLAQPKLLISPPAGGMALSINGNAPLQIDSQKTVPISERTTTNRVLRAKVSASHSGASESFVHFLSPTKLNSIDFGGGLSDRDATLLASLEYVSQLHACVFYHFGPDIKNIGAVIGGLEDDLKALRTVGVDPDVRRLKDHYVEYFREIRKLEDTSIITPLVAQLVVGAIQLAAETYFTGNPTTGKDIVIQVGPDLIEAAYNKYQLDSSLDEANTKFRTAENAIISGLERQLRERPSLKQNQTMAQADKLAAPSTKKASAVPVPSVPHAGQPDARLALKQNQTMPHADKLLAPPTEKASAGTVPSVLPAGKPDMRDHGPLSLQLPIAGVGAALSSSSADKLFYDGLSYYYKARFADAYRNFCRASEGRNEPQFWYGRALAAWQLNLQNDWQTSAVQAARLIQGSDAGYKGVCRTFARIQGAARLAVDGVVRTTPRSD